MNEARTEVAGSRKEMATSDSDLDALCLRFVTRITLISVINV